jgi:hypothetical protein
MKKSLIVIISIAFLSCHNQSNHKGKYNPSGIDPSKLNNRELNMLYGLDAPKQIYFDLKSNIENYGINLKIGKFCTDVKNENVLSSIIGVSIEVDSFKIISASVQPSDYSNKINKLIEHSMEGITWNYELDSNTQSGEFNFRLDLNKMCNLYSDDDL